MTAFSESTIRQRLTRFMALITGGALLCMAIGFFSFEYIAQRSAILRNTQAQAEVVANSADAALEFDATSDAEKILSSISGDKQIRLACIYDRAGNLFASFPPSCPLDALPASPMSGAQYRFSPGILDVSRPILHGSRVLGTVFIRTDLGEIKSRLILTVYILSAMGLVIFSGVFLISYSLQKQISDPILVLSETAQMISHDKDYSIRLTRSHGGEIGVLTDSLNGMLAEIQARDAQLVDYKDHLEDQVAQRSDQLLKMNTQLLIAKERAEEASHTKSAFLANMSHELRTPLNAILLYSEILIDEVTERGAGVLTSDLNKIQSAGRHLLSLIDDILDLSKIEAGRMTIYVEEVDVPSLIADITSTLEPLITRNRNKLTVQTAPAITTIRTDHKRLKQTLFNLLGNALKFTKDGQITLKAQVDEEENFISFQVRDTGIGMSPGQVERIFQEFTQGDDSTTRKFGGTGLGLTLSRKFAEMLGGTIQVESQEGVGSTFTLRIPRTTNATNGAVFVPAKIQPGGNRGKVLIIDDDPAMREAVSRMLTKEGFWAVVASSGEEGLALARAVKPDVITLDIAMPGIDGWQVLSILKADLELADIPVILITMMDGRAKGYALGASDYLQKPVPREELLKRLQKYAVRKSALPLLVVEDDPATREGLERILIGDGWEVNSTQDASGALEQLGRQRPLAILLDLMLPGMDGFQLITEMQGHEDWKSIPIIILTAKELTQQDLERLQTPQVQQVLRKGAFSKEKLMAAVRDLTLRVIEDPAPSEGKG